MPDARLAMPETHYVLPTAVVDDILDIYPSQADYAGADPMSFKCGGWVAKFVGSHEAPGHTNPKIAQPRA